MTTKARESSRIAVGRQVPGAPCRYWTTYNAAGERLWTIFVRTCSVCGAADEDCTSQAQTPTRKAGHQRHRSPHSLSRLCSLAITIPPD
eukprot:6214388-Pleurochrysis_carterae.AAC.1